MATAGSSQPLREQLLHVTSPTLAGTPHPFEEGHGTILRQAQDAWSPDKLRTRESFDKLGNALGWGLMAVRRRDRHGRGIRGPLAVRNPLTGTVVTPPQPPSRQEFFDHAVRDAIDRVTAQCPSAVSGIWVGIEEVPYLETAWSGDRVPLAAAVSPAPETSGRVVLYRRPLEHRAASRVGLAILIFRTLVEQLSALTGLGTDEIDPDGLGDDDL